jgi:hypothetical protein
MGWKVVEEQEAKGSRCRLTFFRDLILGFQPFHRKVGLAWRWQVIHDVRGTIGFLFDHLCNLATLFRRHSQNPLFERIILCYFRSL